MSSTCERAARVVRPSSVSDASERQVDEDRSLLPSSGSSCSSSSFSSNGSRRRRHRRRKQTHFSSSSSNGSCSGSSSPSVDHTDEEDAESLRHRRRRTSASSNGSRGPSTPEPAAESGQEQEEGEAQAAPHPAQEPPLLEFEDDEEEDARYQAGLEQQKERQRKDCEERKGALKYPALLLRSRVVSFAFDKAAAQLEAQLRWKLKRFDKGSFLATDKNAQLLVGEGRPRAAGVVWGATTAHHRHDHAQQENFVAGSSRGGTSSSLLRQQHFAFQISVRIQNFPVEGDEPIEKFFRGDEKSKKEAQAAAYRKFILFSCEESGVLGESNRQDLCMEAGQMLLRDFNKLGVETAYEFEKLLLDHVLEADEDESSEVVQPVLVSSSRNTEDDIKASKALAHRVVLRLTKSGLTVLGQGSSLINAKLDALENMVAKFECWAGLESGFLAGSSHQYREHEGAEDPPEPLDEETQKRMRVALGLSPSIFNAQRWALMLQRFEIVATRHKVVPKIEYTERMAIPAIDDEDREQVEAPGRAGGGGPPGAQRRAHDQNRERAKMSEVEAILRRHREASRANKKAAGEKEYMATITWVYNDPSRRPPGADPDRAEDPQQRNMTTSTTATAIGRGRSKQIAKAHAAEEMLRELKLLKALPPSLKSTWSHFARKLAVARTQRELAELAGLVSEDYWDLFLPALFKVHGEKLLRTPFFFTQKLQIPLWQELLRQAAFHIGVETGEVAESSCSPRVRDDDAHIEFFPPLTAAERGTVLMRRLGGHARTLPAALAKKVLREAAVERERILNDGMKEQAKTATSSKEAHAPGHEREAEAQRQSRATGGSCYSSELHPAHTAAVPYTKDDWEAYWHDGAEGNVAEADDHVKDDHVKSSSSCATRSGVTTAEQMLDRVAQFHSMQASQYYCKWMGFLWMEQYEEFVKALELPSELELQVIECNLPECVRVAYYYDYWGRGQEDEQEDGQGAGGARSNAESAGGAGRGASLSAARIAAPGTTDGDASETRRADFEHDHSGNFNSDAEDNHEEGDEAMSYHVHHHPGRSSGPTAGRDRSHPILANDLLLINRRPAVVTSIKVVKLDDPTGATKGAKRLEATLRLLDPREDDDSAFTLGAGAVENSFSSATSRNSGPRIKKVGAVLFGNRTPMLRQQRALQFVCAYQAKDYERLLLKADAAGNMDPAWTLLLWHQKPQHCSGPAPTSQLLSWSSLQPPAPAHPNRKASASKSSAAPVPHVAARLAEKDVLYPRQEQDRRRRRRDDEDTRRPVEARSSFLEKFGLSETQRHAVNIAIRRQFTVIQGPPGTGKTYCAAIIAVAFLLFHPEKDAKCICCADSNVAADNFYSAIKDLLNRFDFRKYGLASGPGQGGSDGETMKELDGLVQRLGDGSLLTKSKFVANDEMAGMAMDDADESGERGSGTVVTQEEDGRAFPSTEAQPRGRAKAIAEMFARIQKARILVTTCAGAGMDIIDKACNGNVPDEEMPHAVGGSRGPGTTSDGGPPQPHSRSSRAPGAPRQRYKKKIRLVIADEATQSLETSTLVPICQAGAGLHRLVLIGDHKQLAPTVRSRIEQSRDGASLLDRLSSPGRILLEPPPLHYHSSCGHLGPADQYNSRKSVDEYPSLSSNVSSIPPRDGDPPPEEFGSLMSRLVNSGAITPLMLTEQRRMHPGIAYFPNKHFYDGKLKNHEPSREDLRDEDESSSSSISHQRHERERNAQRFLRSLFHRLPPVHFIHVGGSAKATSSGNECRRGDSSFNEKEAAEVVAMVHNMRRWAKNEKSRTSATKKESKDDNDNPQARADFLQTLSVGVITPYNAQLVLLKQLLGDYLYQKRKHGKTFQSLSVDTIDGCQGCEKDVVLFSTVRSNGSGNLGFLSDPRRMNVALTRAKSQLLVFGDRGTLEQSRDWGRDGSRLAYWQEWIKWIDTRGRGHI